MSGSECVRVTVSDRIQEYESEGNRESCISGTKGSKAFPGAEAHRVKGENRNGPNLQGGGTGLWPFLIFSSVRPVFPWKHSQLCL